MVTISDIAKMVDVSRATVSRVLNEPNKVKPETRDKVLRAMAARDYVYNALAGGLSTKRTHTLGLIIPTITNPIFAVSTQGVQDQAGRRGYSILLGATDYSVRMEFELVKLFQAKQVDGLIFTGAPCSETTVPYLQRCRLPHVVTWSLVSEGEGLCVSFDNTRAAHHVIDYLVSMGHQRIGMIAGRFSETGRAEQRWQGYCQALAHHELTVDERLVLQSAYTVASGRAAMARLLRLEPRPTAVFCGNDILAYGAMAAVRDLGLAVGRDVSIVGFDDLEMSAVTDPPLTTVRIPGQRMGAMGADLLIDALEGRIAGTLQCTLETDLIVRQSVMRPSVSGDEAAADKAPSSKEETERES